MGRLGLRTAGDIDRAARWHAPAPRGPRYWTARGVALATYLPATMLFGGSGWLVGIATFILAEVIAPVPIDLDTTAPETSAGAVARRKAASRLATTRSRTGVLAASERRPA